MFSSIFNERKIKKGSECKRLSDTFAFTVESVEGCDVVCFGRVVFCSLRILFSLVAFNTASVDLTILRSKHLELDWFALYFPSIKWYKIPGMYNNSIILGPTPFLEVLEELHLSLAGRDGNVYRHHYSQTITDCELISWEK
jgi:hypothetical protein